MKRILPILLLLSLALPLPAQEQIPEAARKRGAKGWTEKYRYFPIDQSEIDRSNGGLTQNNGWK